jgi:hypothetical protein
MFELACSSRYIRLCLAKLLLEATRQEMRLSAAGELAENVRELAENVTPLGNSLRTSGACAFVFVSLTESLVLRRVLCVVSLAPTGKAMRQCFSASDFKSSMRAAFTRGSPTWLRSFSRRARLFEIFDRSSPKVPLYSDFTQ